MSALDKALNHSRNLGIDECELVAVTKKIITVRITDSEIAEVKHNSDEGYGIRLIHDQKITSIHTTSQQKIKESINRASEMLSHFKSKGFWKGLPHKASVMPLDGVFDKRLEMMSGSQAMDIAQTMINSADNGKVTTVTGSLSIVSENFELANSNGLNLTDKATYISGIINAESEHGMLPVSGIGHTCGRTLSNFSAEQIGNDAKDMCIKSINPQRIDSGTYSIIFEPYSVGELLAFVAASNFDFKTFSEKKSCFSDKSGESIAVSGFDLIDDPHIPEGMGTRSTDAEGIETKPRYLVRDGIFRDTFSNLFDSYNEDGRSSSGNASRPGSPMGRSSEPIPVSSPHNLKINAVDTASQEDMIRDTRHGLLVGRLWYTYAVNPIRGDFSCTARSGISIIENGEIRGPGKSVRIIHNLPVLMKDISAIGNNQKNVVQWASLPSIAPSVKADYIVVNSI